MLYGRGSTACCMRPPGRYARAPWWLWWYWGLVVVLVTLRAGSEAQERSGIDPLGRTGPPPLQLPPAQPPPPLPQPMLPPLPAEPPAGAPPFPQLRVLVRAIQITGSTVFSQEALAKVTASYVNRELTTEDLEALRLALTYLYINAGYINSGAVIPDQTVRDGVITYTDYRGRADCHRDHRPSLVSATYLRQRLALNLEPPLNIAPVQQRLQFLQSRPAHHPP